MNGLQYTKITIFHILWFFIVSSGVICGVEFGRYYFNTIGAIAGGIIGLVIGHIIGCIPGNISHKLFFKSIANSPSSKLRSIVAMKEWNFANTMALLQLAARNEDVRMELPRIVAMLESDSRLTRIYGWDALRIVFTQESNIIEDYNPRGSTEDCYNKTTILKRALAEGFTPSPPPASPTPKIKHRKRKHFSWTGFLLVISFFVVAITIGFIFISATRKPKDSSLVLILVGSMAGFLGAWLIYFPIAQFYLRVIRGYPLHVGDKVEITEGPHKGKTGTILVADKKQGVFKVDVGGQSEKLNENYYEEYELRRLRR